MSQPAFVFVTEVELRPKWLRLLNSPFSDKSLEGHDISLQCARLSKNVHFHLLFNSLVIGHKRTKTK